MANINWRTINIDAYDIESSFNFPLTTLLPANLPASSTSSESAQIAQQVRQLLRAGDSVGALQSALETAPFAGDEGAKQVHLTTVLEVLQGIRQSDVSRILSEILKQPGGTAMGDTLLKYVYKGMASGSSSGGIAKGVSPQATGSGFSQVISRNFGEGGGGQVMSVLLSWHEKLTEVVGVGRYCEGHVRSTNCMKLLNTHGRLSSSQRELLVCRAKTAKESSAVVKPSSHAYQTAVLSAGDKNSRGNGISRSRNPAQEGLSIVSIRFFDDGKALLCIRRTQRSSSD